MNIAILGAGRVGSTLGKKWAAMGHRVTFGVRDVGAEKVLALLAETRHQATAAPVEEAARGAAVVVLATPWEAAQQALAAAGDLSGKVLIDCTNPIRPGLEGLAIGLNTSAAEKIATWVPHADVVKAFSTTGSANMENPHYGAHKLSMFICGDAPEAKTITARLGAEVGFDVIDTGGLFTARYLEPLAMLWIHLAYREGFGPNFGFHLLHR